MVEIASLRAQLLRQARGACIGLSVDEKEAEEVATGSLDAVEEEADEGGRKLALATSTDAKMRLRPPSASQQDLIKQVCLVSCSQAWATSVLLSS